MVYVAKSIVQWPQDVEITGGNGLKCTAGFKHVHARFAVDKILFHTINLSLEELGGSTVEKDDACRESPVAVENVSKKGTKVRHVVSSGRT
jgi:hypothetical protein